MNRYRTIRLVYAPERVSTQSFVVWMDASSTVESLKGAMQLLSERSM